MKNIRLIFYLIVFLFSATSCKNNLQPDATKLVETMDGYRIVANGDLQINRGKQTTVLEINALPDSQIIEDEHQRLLILSDPSDRYQHGILGDIVEASSVTMVQLSEEPAVISEFSVPVDWVIESIRPIWSDWDGGDGEREILLTLSNSTSGSKLVLYDENGNVLAESLAIGKGYRWRHALDIAPFGDKGERLLVDVQTPPHIGGGVVTFYSWDKENKLLRTEATLSGYSTHDIGSRDMLMYELIVDEQNEQVLLILPNQSKTELAALRFESAISMKNGIYLLVGG